MRAPREKRSGIDYNGGVNGVSSKDLVAAHARDVLGLVSMMVHDPAAAEALTQSIFERAFADADRDKQEDPRTWLLAIARDRCIEHLQASETSLWGTDSGFDKPPTESDPDELELPFDLVERRADVKSALVDLGEAERALIALRYGHNIDYATLATVFKEDESAIRSRLVLALRRMRRALETTVTDLPLDTPHAPAGTKRDTTTDAQPIESGPSSARLLELYFAEELPVVSDSLQQKLLAAAG
jgi:RNA polymerase sigma factor (sigma-70 family)